MTNKDGDMLKRATQLEEEVIKKGVCPNCHKKEISDLGKVNPSLDSYICDNCRRLFFVEIKDAPDCSEDFD
jgi:transposase-like protein